MDQYTPLKISLFLSIKFSLFIYFSPGSSLDVYVTVCCRNKNTGLNNVMLIHFSSILTGPTEYPPCTCAVTKAPPDFLQALERPFCPKSFRQFCERVIQLSNELSDGERFERDLAAAGDLSGYEFIDQYMTGFSAPDMQDIKIYQLIKKLVTKRLHKSFKGPVDLLAKAVLRNHECEICTAHIHRELHTEGLPEVTEPGQSGSCSNGYVPQEYCVVNETNEKDALLMTSTSYTNGAAVKLKDAENDLLDVRSKCTSE